jgi:hypothetical protein
MDPITVIVIALIIGAAVVLFLIFQARKPDVISITIRPSQTRRIMIAGNEGHIWQNDDGQVCLLLNSYEDRFSPVLGLWADKIEEYSDFASYWSKTGRGMRLVCLIRVDSNGGARRVEGIKELQWSNIHHAGHGIFQLMGGEKKDSLLVGEYEYERVVHPVVSPLVASPYNIALANLARVGGMLTVQVEGGIYRAVLNDGVVTFRPFRLAVLGAVDAEFLDGNTIVLTKDQAGVHYVSVYSSEKLIEGPHMTGFNQIAVSTSQVNNKWIQLCSTSADRPYWDSPSIVFWKTGAVQYFQYSPAYVGKTFKMVIEPFSKVVEV